MIKLHLNRSVALGKKETIFYTKNKFNNTK